MRRLLIGLVVLLGIASVAWALTGVAPGGNTVQSGQANNVLVPAFTHANCGGM